MKYYLLLFFILLFLAHFAYSCEKISNCLSCNKVGTTCLQCEKGYYLHMNACANKCPMGLFADNYSMKCKTQMENPVYTKAYTQSRCLNSCGRKYDDCSCERSCMQDGTCCSDIKFCDIITSQIDVEKYGDKSLIPHFLENCKYVTSDLKKCLQCRKGYYYFQNKCYSTCPQGTVALTTTNLCIENSSCSIDLSTSCEKCDQDGGCIECRNGYYLHNTKCLSACPVGYKANRVNFTCQNGDLFSFYWIYPSKNSCKNSCGAETDECSCDKTCVRKGICCDDYDENCVEGNEDYNSHCQNCEMCKGGICLKCKENSKVNSKGQCLCDDSFVHSVEYNTCIKKTLQKSYRLGVEERSYGNNITTVASSKPGSLPNVSSGTPRPSVPSSNKTQIEMMTNADGIIESSHIQWQMREELFQSFQNIFSFGLEPPKKGQTGNVILFNGTSSIDVYSRNKGLNIKKQVTTSKCSFNNHHQSESNINSKNIFLNGTSNRTEKVSTSEITQSDESRTVPKVTNNHILIHNNIYLDDLSTTLYDSQNASVFNFNNSYGNYSIPNSQIIIGRNQTINGTVPEAVSAQNLIVINQNDIVNHNTFVKNISHIIEKIPIQKPVEEVLVGKEDVEENKSSSYVKYEPRPEPQSISKEEVHKPESAPIPEETIEKKSEEPKMSDAPVEISKSIIPITLTNKSNEQHEPEKTNITTASIVEPVVSPLPTSKKPPIEAPTKSTAPPKTSVPQIEKVKTEKPEEPEATAPEETSVEKKTEKPKPKAPVKVPKAINETKTVQSKINETKTVQPKINKTKTAQSKINKTKTAQSKINETKTAQSKINITQPKKSEDLSPQNKTNEVIHYNKSTTTKKVKAKKYIDCNLDPLCHICDDRICKRCKYNSHLDDSFDLEIAKCVCNDGFYYDMKTKTCTKCNPMCEACYDSGADKCSRCAIFAKFAKNSTICECKRGLEWDKYTQECVESEFLFKIVHLQPMKCPKNEYWESRVGNCVENRKNMTKEIRFSSILYLHGLTSPANVNQNGVDFLGQKWDVKKRQLTSAGMRSDYLTGLYFQEKYLHFHQLIHKDDMNIENIKVFSASDAASMLSSYSLILGMFPAAGAEENLHHHHDLNNFSTVNTSSTTRKRKAKPRSNIENPFEEEPELETSIETAAKYLPSIQSQSAMQEYSDEFGIANITHCYGANEMILQNQIRAKERMSEIARELERSSNIKNSFKFGTNTTFDISFVKNFSDSYFLNLAMGNRIIIKKFLPKAAKDLLKEFRNLEMYYNIYGDKDGYLYRAIITPFMSRLLTTVNNAIKAEKKNMEKVIKNYLKTGHVDLQEMEEYLKLNIQVPEKSVFMGLIKLISEINKEKNEVIPNKATAISFDIYKKKLAKLNLTDFAIKLSTHSQKPKGKKEEEKEEEEKLKFSSDRKEAEMFLKINDNKTTKKADKKSEKKKEKSEKSEKKKDTKMKGIGENKTETPADDYYGLIIPRNHDEYKKEMNRLFNNRHFYNIRMYLNHKLVLDLPYVKFIEKVNSYTVDKDEFKEFCFPSKFSIWFIVCCVLFILILLELFVIAGMNAFLK